jgi:SulP family sulfate permease
MRQPGLRADLVAGVTTWGIVVPQALAYAQIAGLPPQAGLLAAPWALAVYAMLGSSSSLIVAATSSTAALSAVAVAPLVHADAERFAALSATLALVTGAVFALAGALRVGGIADLISKPVLTGFLFGLGLTIAIGQLPKLLGVESARGTFASQLLELLERLGATDGPTLAVGAISLAALLALRHWLPAVPGGLVVLAGALALSAALGLAHDGVAVVGHVPAVLPRLAVPNVHLSDLPRLLPGACGVALVGYTEAITVARSTASARGESIDANRELLALGAANGAAGFGQGFVQSGGASQTAAAVRAGARTQRTSLVAGALVVVTGALLAPVFKDLPQATLGAIVVVAVSGFLRVDELVRFARIRRSAVVLSLVALVGVLLVGVLPGLVIAVALSLVLVVRRLSRPSVSALVRNPINGEFRTRARHSDWEPVPGVLVTRVDGALFYANATVVKERLLALVDDEQPRTLVLSLGESPELDLESVDMLDDLRGALDRAAVELLIVDVHDRAEAILDRAGVLRRIHVERDPTTALTVCETPASPTLPQPAASG